MREDAASYKNVSSCTGCSRVASLCVYSTLDDKGHGVVLLLALRRLRRRLFTDLN